MIPDQIAQKLEGLIEVLAAVEHERWSHWQRYMHGKGVKQADGSLLVPADLVRRWQNQIDTPYAALSEKEKESDREQVRKYVPLILRALTDERT
ncbi:hypothetical protein [Bradyrhizobium sp. SZCCHNR3003]|uniref:hypothetical protein n=1 Tax=Bradyrhizobium sp. SZCCHNR3003 TaxID=3057387 RepID=UPI00291695A1|nr:hypothetical protein [Bradyrhizobium sp. SZCCHNR3003]